MRQRLFTKYFCATGVLVVASLTVMMMIMTVVYNNYLAKEEYNNLKTTCNSVSSFFNERHGNLYDFENQKGMYYIMKNAAQVTDNDVYITDSVGVIKICTCDQWINSGNCEHTGTRIDKRFFEESLKKSEGKITTLGIFKEPHYVYSSLIRAGDGTVIGMTVAASPISDLKGLLRKVGKIYIFSAIVPLAIMFVALYIITYRLTKPLKLMSDAAKSMASGDFSKRIPVTGEDEIGKLAVSFNQMTNSLSRLESMRKTFIADVSHELKTPMTTIGGFIDGIIDGTIEPEKADHYLKLVSDEIKRLSRITESMLEAARIESDRFTIKKEQIDFKELLLNTVLSSEQRIEEKNLDIIGLDKIESVTVLCDKDLIHRVIYNLVDNAIKFSNEGGKIAFDTEFNQRQLTFLISNTGTTIRKEDLPYVFERFYKTDKSRSQMKNSTGLGLYMVKNIIEKHGGTVSVTSGAGLTTFRFTLPL